ncbi:MAG: hypothetical protein M0022_00305 [Desulfobacteraceae bacterium]|nr:hypothetical protein [Desulfobacteraceae bacterium]
MNDMPFGTESLIAFIIMCAISLPIIFYLRGKYKKRNKVVRNLDLKVAVPVVISIMSIVIFSRHDLIFQQKIQLLAIIFIGAIAYAYAMSSARKALHPDLYKKASWKPDEDENEINKKKRKD